MKFWDASALVPLLVQESTSPYLHGLAEADPDILAWWAAEVECASALARLARESAGHDGTEVGFALLARAVPRWRLIAPSEEVKSAAVRSLRVHPLRAADALQLAAAVLAAGNHPATLPFVSLDNRLRAAAAREGFPLLPV